MGEKLRNFYRGEGTDSEGRMFSEIVGWTDFFWEGSHDHIQWMFPTKRASNFNEDAPLLTEEDIAIWKADPLLQGHLMVAYLRWLKFLGLEEREGQVGFVAELKPYQKHTWENYNHNFWRTTRVLDSLVTLGLEKEARAFYQFLKSQYNEKPDLISAHTFDFWTKAVNGQIV